METGVDSKDELAPAPQTPPAILSLTTRSQREMSDSKTSAGTSPSSDAEIAARFEKRRTALETACSKYSSDIKSKSRPTITVEALPPIWNTTVDYCPIHKVSSTTWTYLLGSLRRNITKRYKEAALKQENQNSTLWMGQKKKVRFTFVREPYGRLLSAYVDKILSPNTLFWSTHTRHIVENFRPGATEHSLRCGHNVTFPEYVKFFIHMQTTGIKRDGHFTPLVEHCNMCEEPHFDYIGHLETLREDMPFLLKTIHSPVSYTTVFDNETILDNAGMVLKAMRSRVQECMDLDEACRRLWKKWHIRGIISKSIAFPLTKGETHNITAKQFIAVALSALAKSGDKTARKAQKKEALKEAFSSIPLEDRQEVKRLLFLDFQMFGFPSEPEEVFPRSASVEDNSGFRYFDLYK